MPISYEGYLICLKSGKSAGLFLSTKMSPASRARGMFVGNRNKKSYFLTKNLFILSQKTDITTNILLHTPRRKSTVCLGEISPSIISYTILQMKTVGEWLQSAEGSLQPGKGERSAPPKRPQDPNQARQHHRRRWNGPFRKFHGQ